MVSTQEEISVLFERDVEETEKEFLEDSIIEESIEDDLQAAGEEFEDDDDAEFVVSTTHERTSEASDVEVEQYTEEGKCGCQKASNGQPCSASLSTDDVTAYQLDMCELDRTELDLVILAQLQSVMHSDKLLTNTRGTTRHQFANGLRTPYLRDKVFVVRCFSFFME